jgi:hypothetical protein
VICVRRKRKKPRRKDAASKAVGRISRGTNLK